MKDEDATLTRAVAPPYRRLGAHLEAGGTRFAVLARATSCAVELLDSDERVTHELELEQVSADYFELFTSHAQAGTLYRFVVDGRRLPDPYARYLPRGVHGPAQVVRRADAPRSLLPCRPLSEQVIYELHIGTFTEQGTFAAALERLPALVDLGITTLELMPIAAFAGERGWGYDGVALFAPHAAYGTREELRALVDAAHELGLGVLLDVVYNHLGPSGNYLAAYFPGYFSETLENAWGKAPSFSEPAFRSLVLENARYWLSEFGFDGLRLDATHALVDPSPKHILEELCELAHQLTPPRLVLAEDERNLAELVSTTGIDALWADDFHHQLRVTLTGERSGYYAAYQPTAQALADAINRGWIYAGQPSPLTGVARGSSAEALPAEAFIYCIQNHDQIGNRALGDRLSQAIGHDAFRAASLLLLFLPMTPLLFMGQEWASSAPFLYFTDHEPELGQQIREGRRREFAGFPEFSDPRQRESIPDPQARDTFVVSKLRWWEREQPEHAATLELYRSALALRRADEVLRHANREALSAEARGQVLVVQRWWQDQRRALLFNLGDEPQALAPLTRNLDLVSATPLLRSSRQIGESLPGRGAVVIGGGAELLGSRS